MSVCPVCVAYAADLGEPSQARWVGPDGDIYCSMHFVQKFGHGERLVRIDGYEPPAKAKEPAPRGAKNARNTES